MNTDLSEPIVNQKGRKPRKTGFNKAFTLDILSVLCVSLICVFLVCLIFYPDWMRPIYNLLPSVRNLLNIPYVDVKGKYSYSTHVYVSPDGDYTCNFGTLYAGALLVDDTHDTGSFLEMNRGYIGNDGDFTINQEHIGDYHIPTDDRSIKDGLLRSAQYVRKNDRFLSHFKNLTEVTDEFITQTPILYYWFVKGISDQKSTFGVAYQGTGVLSFVSNDNLYMIFIDYAPFTPYSEGDKNPPATDNDLQILIKKLLLDFYHSCEFR